MRARSADFAKPSPAVILLEAEVLGRQHAVELLVYRVLIVRRLVRPAALDVGPLHVEDALHLEPEGVLHALRRPRRRRVVPAEARELCVRHLFGDLAVAHLLVPFGEERRQFPRLSRLAAVKIEFAAGERAGVMYAANPARRAVLVPHVLEEDARALRRAAAPPQVGHLAAFGVFDPRPALPPAVLAVEALLRELQKELGGREVEEGRQAEDVEARQVDGVFAGAADAGEATAADPTVVVELLLREPRRVLAERREVEHRE